LNPQNSNRTIPVNKPGFEFYAASPGEAVATIAPGWAAFKKGCFSDIGSQKAAGIDYTVNHPPAGPADEHPHCYIDYITRGAFANRQ
jgi:hypothetical protein